MIVKLHFGVVVQLFILMQNGALWAHLVIGRLASGVAVSRAYSLVIDADGAFVAIFLALGSESLDLFNNQLSWVKFINHREKAPKLSLMPRHYLQLSYQITSLLASQQSQFVNIITISFVIQSLYKFHEINVLITYPSILL